jgi:hypothetical protein
VSGSTLFTLSFFLVFVGMSLSCVIFFFFCLFSNVWCGKSLLDELRSIPNNIEFNPHSLTKAASRKDVCTLVIAGTHWDGSFKSYVRLKYWEKITKALQPINHLVEVGFITYSTVFGGKRPLPQITPDAWPPDYQGYDFRAFSNGKDYNHDRLSQLKITHFVESISESNLRQFILNICQMNYKDEL